MLASGTVILEGSITLKTAGKEYVITLPAGERIDAIFLTPRGVKLLEQHYRYVEPPHTQADTVKANAIRDFIAKFHEKPPQGN